MFQDVTSLRQGNAGEPLNELMARRVFFEVLDVAADVFEWRLGDQGTGATPASVQITDFTLGAGGDVLDLRNLLQGEIAA